MSSLLIFPFYPLAHEGFVIYEIHPAKSNRKWLYWFNFEYEKRHFSIFVFFCFFWQRDKRHITRLTGTMDPTCKVWRDKYHILHINILKKLFFLDGDNSFWPSGKNESDVQMVECANFGCTRLSKTSQSPWPSCPSCPY